MFEFEYQLSVDDYVEFNIYHTKNSKTVKNRILFIQILVPIVLMLISIIYYGNLLGISISFITSVLYFIFIPQRHLMILRKMINKMVNEGDKGDIFELKKYKIDDTGIFWTSSTSEGKYNWSGVVKMCDLEEFIYLYFNPVQALIIPKRIIGDDSQFVEFCRTNMKGKTIE